MKTKDNEIALLEQIEAPVFPAEIRELADLQLALVGGGIGETIL